MTDETPTSRPRKRQDEEIQDAVVVDETDQPVDAAAQSPAAAEPPVAPEAAETVVAEVTPVTPASTAEPAPRIVYIQAPPRPVNKGNRGFGVLMAVLGTAAFAALLAGAGMIIRYVAVRAVDTVMFTRLEFYIPIAIFLIAFIVLVLLANRAAWWAYILGSLVIGLVVYFATIGVTMLAAGGFGLTAGEAASFWHQGIISPFNIAAGLLAREVSMWLGVAIARRGRKVKARNAERKEAWEREVAEQRAEHERAASGAAPASV